GQDVPVLPQCRGDPIPIAAMISPAMDQQQRRRARVSPIDVMQAQTLREINARSRSGAAEGHLFSRCFGTGHEPSAGPKKRKGMNVQALVQQAKTPARSQRQAGVGSRSLLRARRKAELDLGL